MIRGELDALASLSYASHQSGIALVRQLRVRNDGPDAVGPVTCTVGIEPPLGAAWTRTVPVLGAGEQLVLDDIAPAVDIAALRGQLERERRRLVWSVEVAGAVAASGHAELDVLAMNEWPGTAPLPHLLAAFVLPNDPAVAKLLLVAARRLELATGDPAIDGYQRRDRRRVLAIVEAIYGAIQAAGVTYLGTPASFEVGGQKVRLPSALLQGGQGNCLDVSVLAAACLEQAGLNPVLVLVRGHAFPGVWLGEDRLGEAWSEAAAHLQNLVQIGDVFVFDSSTTVARPEQPMRDAEVAARAHLADFEAFRGVVDVAAARVDRILPLAVAGEASTATAPGRAAADGAGLYMERTLAARERQEGQAARGKANPRLDRWLRQLLDLTMRNRLLNLRLDSKQIVPLVCPALPDPSSDAASLAATVEDVLAGGERLELRPWPTPEGADPRAAKAAPADGHEALARRELAARRLLTRLTAAETDRRVVELFRTARTDLEDGGANTLYLAIGLLHWAESDSSELRTAPILLTPVRLVRESARAAFTLVRTDEEPWVNQTLFELLRAQFGLDLGALATVPVDESGVDVDAVLTAVRKAIVPMTRWHVTAELNLGLFKFAKFLMWRDLDAHAAALLESPIVRSLVEDTPLGPIGNAGGPWVPPAQLDSALSPEQIPLVLDADSSQIAIVNAALSGRSFAVQGPPGTGKSQTIANLIAAALGEGKTVLFVAEKLAALSVVFERLRHVGLGDFCLELHSNKASKLDVVQSLARVLEGSRPARLREGEWRAASDKLRALRDRLNAYDAALHEPRPLGRSVYQVASERRTLERAPELTGLRFPKASLMTDAEWTRLAEVTLRLVDAGAAQGAGGDASTGVEGPAAALAPSGPPFRAIRQSRFTTTLQADVRRGLLELPALVAAVDAREAALRSLLSLPPALGCTTETRALAGLATAIAEAPPAAVLDRPRWAALEPKLREYARRRTALAETRTALSVRYSNNVYSLDLKALAARFARWADAFVLLSWLMLWGARRLVRGALVQGALPPAREVATDLQTADSARQEQDAVAQLRTPLEADFGVAASVLDTLEPSRVDAISRMADALATVEGVPATSMARLRALTHGGTATDHGAVRDAGRALTDALAALEAAEDALAAHLIVPAGAAWPHRHDPAHRPGLLATAARWLGALDELRSACAWRAAVDEATEAGLGPLALAIDEGRLRPDEAMAACRRALLTQWLDETEDQDPRLASFEGARHHRAVSDFATDDRAHLTLARAELRSRLYARVPDPSAAEGSATSEAAVLLRESKKKARHLPLRRLLQSVPNLLPRLKPCLMMSPLSVAQYLPIDGRKFDLVVFDEASQIGPHDAIGTLARGRQVIVVGDSKQLPPTTFFDKSADEGEGGVSEDAIVDLESILDEVVASGLPQHGLEWHYRSRDERLIAFSNHHYYDGRLHTFPGASALPDQAGPSAPTGVVWHPISTGHYERGGSNVARGEAEALVARVVAIVKDPDSVTLTLGVVTFSMPQQALIEDLLDAARRRDPSLDEAISARREPLFVKNLENVQGDERDIILFSITFGPDAAGKVLMNFGPLNKKGGERRLNVAITRARVRLEVFALLRHDHIDLSKTAAMGVRHLKDFLRYAEYGPRALGISGDPTSRGADSPLEQEVAAEITRLGFTAHPQVGCGGYRIDIGVVDPERPGRYLLGVECDGATYHSAKTARDRDRLRQQVLESLGWRLHRIWSTDFRHHRKRELERLRLALVEAQKVGPVHVLAPPRAPEAPPPPSPPVESTPVRPPRAAVTVPYTRAALSPVGDREQLASGQDLAAVLEHVRAVIAAEAPVHVDVVARRVAAAWGVERLTGRPRETIDRAIALAVSRQHAQRHDAFLWTSDPEAFDAPRSDDDSREADHLPVEEVAAVARRLLAVHLSVDEAELIRLVAGAFGYTAVGRRIKERAQAGVDWLVEKSQAAREDGRVSGVHRAR